MDLKVGRHYEKCRWIMERSDKSIGGRDFFSGGRPMPYALLNFVPECNLKRLNKASQKRWAEYLKNNKKPI